MINFMLSCWINIQMTAAINALVSLCSFSSEETIFDLEEPREFPSSTRSITNISVSVSIAAAAVNNSYNKAWFVIKKVSFKLEYIVARQYLT